MKLFRKEQYKISNISKADFIFLLEVIDKIVLDENSSDVARQSLSNWKAFKQQVQISSSQDEIIHSFESLKETEKLKCDGCESLTNSDTTSISLQKCPVTGEHIPLCDTCFSHRELLLND